MAVLFDRDDRADFRRCKYRRSGPPPYARRVLFSLHRTLVGRATRDARRLDMVAAYLFTGIAASISAYIFLTNLLHVLNSKDGCPLMRSLNSDSFV